MMKNPFLYLILLFLWIPFGAFWYNNSTCCGVSNPLQISDAGKVLASNAENLRFGLAAATPLIPTAVKEEYGDVVTYLQQEPGRTFELTGHYQSDEQNNTSFENLGIGRAEAIKAYFVSQGIAASRIFTNGLLQDELVIDQKEVIGAMDYGFGSRGLVINDGSLFGASDYDNFRFDRSGFIPATPLSDALNGVMTKTADYLKTNPKRSIKITGYYGQEESNKSILPNLGLARANAIKEILISSGVDASQIALNAKMVEQPGFEEEQLYGGLEYDFFATPEADNSLEEIYARLKGQPIILYFQTNSENLELNEQQRKDFSDIIYYLDRKADARVQAQGHTDSRGDYDSNQRLSRKRAESVRNYLSKNGIDAGKIIANGTGPDQPIADNESPEGRAKNRRVEVQLK